MITKLGKTFMRIRENKSIKISLLTTIKISYLEDTSFDCSGALWAIKCLPWLETSCKKKQTKKTQEILGKIQNLYLRIRQWPHTGYREICATCLASSKRMSLTQRIRTLQFKDFHKFCQCGS